MSVVGAGWRLARETVENFIDHGALSRGASIAYYTLFSIAPMLLVAIGIAGFIFGREAAEGAIVSQLSGLMGLKTATVLQDLVQSARQSEDGVWASFVGIALLMLSSSVVFGEVQTALNAIWKAEPQRSTLTRFVRAKLASMGVVITCGFLLMVSLALSAALAAVSAYLAASFPTAQILLPTVDFLLSLTLISFIFAAMYKLLPDAPIAWRDVIVGAIATTLLFQGGKYLIALYIGQSDIASSFGAAGALIIFLLWVYYSAQIFLLGAEFTRAFAQRYGSHAPGVAEGS